ncbi:hypothetical protein L1D52_09890 [Vibrio brasiliensis]|uniref:hypothetical protein n=1 Tax=Vibrio brasiliensis TaxID=170652 RepID=UPI001EFDEF78|nr:hypothetical protein [Vibrio brasiliensis]MCG9782666.1 hypothetical protein [Vibrio brasiliensis]
MKSIILLIESICNDTRKIVKSLFYSAKESLDKTKIELERSTKSGAYFFPSENYYFERFRNFVSPNTQHKNIVYLTFFIALVISWFISSQHQRNDLALGISLSVVAACIFDIVLNIVPLEILKYERAMKIQKIVGNLMELKYANYINYGFRRDPFDEGVGMFVRSKPLDRQSAVELIRLIDSHPDDKPLVPNISAFHWNESKFYVPSTNAIYLAFSYEIFEKGLICIARLSENGVFPDLERTALQMLEVIAENRTLHGKNNLFTPNAINHYFAYTDVLAHRTNLNCLAYCRLQFGGRRDILEPTETFMREAKHIGNITWH